MARALSLCAPPPMMPSKPTSPRPPQFGSWLPAIHGSLSAWESALLFATEIFPFFSPTKDGLRVLVAGFFSSDGG